MSYSKREVRYSSDEQVVIESIIDDMRFAKCMKLYKAYDTIEKLDNALTKEALIKINQIH